MLDDVRQRCNAIEECYEFMLAYAAQGLPSDGNNKSGGQLRHFLTRAVDALSGLSESYEAAAKQGGIGSPASYQAFLGVLDRDASDSLAALEMVLAQPSISSQLIDNLNASIHLRALLTDLFLIDEIIKPQQVTANPAATN
jgi:hypothetical protein